MFEVLKSSLTRRLLLLFIALSILPTLAMVIIPLLIRAKEQQKAVTALETSLQENAATTFSNLVNTKANHYEQRLNQRFEIFSIFINQRNIPEQQVWSDNVDWLINHDPAFLYLLMRSDNEKTVCLSNKEDTSPCSASSTEIDFPERINRNPAWQIFIDPKLSYSQLLLHGNQDNMEILIAYNLNVILNEVPRFGLAPHSTLLLINDQGEILGYPSNWGTVELLDQLNFPKEELHGKNLSSSLPVTASNIFNPENLQPYIQNQQAHVFSAQFQDEKIYFAFRNIEDTPINVLLMLPLTDIYGQAAFYGASLARMDILPAITQAAISTIGFLLVIFLGALLSLRVIASPIKTLHDGATAISNNHLNTRVEETGLGEMKGLAIAFNRMASAIQTSQEHLKSNQLELKNTLSARVEELSTMNGIIAFTNADIDLPHKLNGVIQILCETLEICNARIFLYDPEGKLYLASQFDSECHFDDLENNPTEIEISFSKQRLGKLLLNCATEHSLNPIHTDFLKALSTTIGVLIKNAELQSQVRSITISEERRHLARELHDSVTQTLFSVSLAAEGLKGAIGENNNPAVQRALNLLSDQLGQVRSEMRGLILELRPIELGTQNLEEAILGHAASLQRATNIEIDTKITGPVENLPHDIQTGVNRIIQESLSNIARHARADKVTIEMHYANEKVTLVVKDNGIGFDVKTATQRIGAYGLINIRERSELFGGQVNIQSSKNKGTTITVIIPVKESTS